MARIITKEILQKEIDEKFGEGLYILKEEYKGTNTTIEIYHSKCKHTFKRRPKDFNNEKDSTKCMCSKCNGTYRRTPKEFLEDITITVPNLEIISKEEIKNVRQVVEVRCKTCGKISSKPVRKLLEGNGCSNCHSEKQIEYYKSIKTNNSDKKSNGTLTQEQFKDKLKSMRGENFEVLEEYKGYDIPIKFYHKTCGNEFIKEPRNLLKMKGDNCPCCSKSKRRTYETLIEEIKQLRGNEFILKTDHYENNKQKMLFHHNKCNEDFEMRIDCFLRGDSCPKCQKISKTDDTIKKEIKVKYGNEYSFIDNSYTNNKKTCKVKHNKCGNIIDIWLSDFINPKKPKYNCPICSNKSTKRKTDEIFKKELYDKYKDEYIPLEKYNGSHSIIIFKHNIENCMYEFPEKPYNIIKRNSKCPVCTKLSSKQTPESFKIKFDRIVKGEYTLLSDYNNARNYIKVRHNYDIKLNGKKVECGHIWDILPTEFMKGHRCPICCYKTSSKGEIEIEAFIQKNYKDEFKTRDREVLEGEELDFYFPKLKLAIEYDGLYYHTEEKLFERFRNLNKFKDCKDSLLHKYARDYHLAKTIMCEQKGITLIHIYEDEWYKNKKILKRKIKYLLKKSYDLPKINARDCYIKEVSFNKIENFLNKYHIQGASSASIYLALYGKSPKTGKNILLSVMTFCKPRSIFGSKINKTFDYELSRFASNTNYIVNGSFAKLFSYFKKNYEWNKIFTYADRRYSNGKIYEVNGWRKRIEYDENGKAKFYPLKSPKLGRIELIGQSKPSYSYTNGRYRVNRYNYRKENLRESGTEKEIMETKGMYQIFDCGTLCFEYTR